MKNYETISENKSLKIEIYYSKGGYNNINGKQERRGYYLSVVPVKIDNYNGYSIESFTAYSGIKKFLLEVQKKSDKAYNQAVLLSQNEIPALKEYVLSKVN